MCAEGERHLCAEPLAVLGIGRAKDDAVQDALGLAGLALHDRSAGDPVGRRPGAARSPRQR